jgi:hypothetical protein
MFGVFVVAADSGTHLYHKVSLFGMNGNAVCRERQDAGFDRRGGPGLACHPARRLQVTTARRVPTVPIHMPAK